MTNVEFFINGKKYSIGCKQGEEDKIRNLANNFDERIKNLRSQFSIAGDMMLLVIAGIMQEDEISSLKERIKLTPANNDGYEDEIAITINELAGTIENLALKLENM